MPDFTYPTSIALQTIAQELVPRLTSARPIFDIFPIENDDNYLVAWEQKDLFTGLQAVRGLNGDPPRVRPVSGKRFVMPPGVYGEHLKIDEEQLTIRRQWGSFNQPINIIDLVMEAQEKLLQRRLDRIESICWTLLATGTFSVADGPVVVQTDAFTMQSFAAGTPWSTFGASTPLADIRSVQLKQRGYSVDFGPRAKMYMNRSTLNNMLSNTNANDLGGRRGAGLSSINGISQFNELMMMDGLPTALVYDQGYVDDTGVFQLYIPNNKVIVVGERTPAGDPVGKYKMVRNANNPGMEPGPYMRVIEREDIPRQVVVHDGHNGGPALYHPSAIVVMSV